MAARRQVLRRFLFAASLLCAGGGAAFAADAAPSLGARVDAAVDRAIAQRRLVGAVVVVIENGDIVHHRAYGYADREVNRRTTVDTIFRLASCSKTIVSVAALVLVDQGRLSLDDPVRRWLPDFSPRLPDGRAPDVTIRQLLTHTAGFSYPFMEPADGPYHRERVSTGLDMPGLPMREELARIARAGLAFEPGTEWRYSVAIDVLGAVVAAVAKKSLPDAVRELVTGPLALADTGFTVREARRLAVPYYQAKGGLLRMGEPQDVDFPGIGVLTFAPSRNLDATSFPSGGAGMSATAIAFARLLDAIRAGGSPLLKRDTARAMLANQIGTLPTVMGPGWGFGYGGAVLTDATAAQTPQSNGTWLWSGVYGNSWFVDPVRGLTVVAFTNTAPEGDSGPFVAELRDAVYGTKPATDSARPTSCAVATDANCPAEAARILRALADEIEGPMREHCADEHPPRHIPRPS